MHVVLLHFTFAEYATSLANALVDHAEVTMVHPATLTEACVLGADPRIRMMPFDKPRLRSISNVGTMRRLVRHIAELQPDVVHLQANGEFWFELSLLGRKFPPLVVTCHDVSRHPGDRASFRIPGSLFTARIPLRRARRVIVHSTHQRDALASAGTVPPERIDVVSIGEYGTIYRTWAQGRAVPEREPYTVLFFGRIWPYKGLRYLVEAMPIVREQFPDARLIIAGRGEGLDGYFPGGADPRTYEIIDGFIPNADVAALFERSSVCVLPYIEASQSGVAAISLGLGTPVIASDVGGLGELVRDGEDGFLVPPADSEALAAAIIRVLGDATLTMSMSAAAGVRCQTDLDWSNIALETIGIYGRAVPDPS